MKKRIKKAISKIIPKGKLKERIKIVYYNFMKPKGVSYAISFQDNECIHKTSFSEMTIFSKDAIYPILDDFKYYQHFYTVKHNDIVLDAGANAGILSIYFSRNIGQYGKVYSFEPDDINVNLIEENMQLNKDLHNNIEICKLLLWNKNELVNFEEAGTEGSSAVLFSGTNNAVKKQAVTIDSWVKDKKIDKLNFIKMDIEGAEIEALEGCVETMKTLNPNFAIASYHIVNNEPTYIALEKFFSKMDYPYKTITFRKNEIITFAGPSILN